MTLWMLLTIRRHRPRTTAWAVLGMLSLAALGCAHPEALVDRSLTVDPQVAALRAQSADSRSVAGASAGVVRLRRSPSAATLIGSPSAIQSSTIDTQGFESESFIINVSHAESAIAPVPAEACPPYVYAPCPRAGGPCGPGCPNCSPTQACPVIVNGPGVVAWDPTEYPDEYLCDGGDRGAPFHYEGRNDAGLETEDTIAEAYDITGKRLVVPSSKVCIYAPRFGALRTISGTSTELDIQQATGAHEGRRLAGIDTHLNIIEETQRDQLLQFDVRSRPSSMDTESRDSNLHQGTVAGLHQQQLAAFQNLTRVREGEFQQSDLAALSYGVRVASIWSRDDSPVIYAHDAHGHELEVEFNAAEYVGTEDKRSPGLLRVVKLADKEIARPGDEITFTIRFVNSGQRELHRIRIVDNLTPRLTYVEGSADSETPGALDVEPNGEGSSLLTFRLDEPLAGESSGEITFRCQVR